MKIIVGNVTGILQLQILTQKALQCNLSFEFSSSSNYFRYGLYVLVGCVCWQTEPVLLMLLCSVSKDKYPPPLLLSSSSSSSAALFTSKYSYAIKPVPSTNKHIQPIHKPHTGNNYCCCYFLGMAQLCP